MSWLPSKETYTERQEGKIAVHMESLNALRYARAFALEGEALTEVVFFSEKVREIGERQYSILTITRKTIRGTGGLRIEVRAIEGSEVHSVGYTCLSAAQ